MKGKKRKKEMKKKETAQGKDEIHFSISLLKSSIIVASINLLLQRESGQVTPGPAARY